MIPFFLRRPTSGLYGELQGPILREIIPMYFHFHGLRPLHHRASTSILHPLSPMTHSRTRHSAAAATYYTYCLLCGLCRCALKATGDEHPALCVHVVLWPSADESGSESAAGLQSSTSRRLRWRSEVRVGNWQWQCAEAQGKWRQAPRSLRSCSSWACLTWRPSAIDAEWTRRVLRLHLFRHLLAARGP
jgi:hypothetical protein